MYSQSTTDGDVTITVTFKLGTDLDKAQVLVQKRGRIAEPRLPEEVRRNGVVTKQELARPAAGRVHWCRPTTPTISSTSPTTRCSTSATRCCASMASATSDVRRARILDADVARSGQDRRARPDRRRGAGRVRAQNVQVAGGPIAEPPICRSGLPAAISRSSAGSRSRMQFENIIVKSGADGRLVRLQGRRPDRARRAELLHQRLISLRNRPWRWRSPSGRDPTRWPRRTASRRDGRAGEGLPQGPRLSHRLQPDRVHRASRSHELIKTIFEAIVLVVLVVHAVPADAGGGDHPDRRHSGVADRHLRGDGRARILASTS